MSTSDSRLPTADLTPREREVLDLIARGRTNAEIATELGISFNTAKWHVTAVISKLGVATREEAAIAWRDSQSLRNRSRRGLSALIALPLGKLALGATLGAGGIVGAGTLAFAIASTIPSDAPSEPHIVLLASETPSPTPSPTPDPAEPDLPTLAEHLSSMAPVSAYQAAFLADGVLTLAEYESAIAGLLACGAVDGWEPNPIPGEGLRPTSIGFARAGPPDSTETAAHERVMSACRTEYYDELSVVWALQLAEAAPQTRNAAYAALNQCMAGQYGAPFDRHALLDKLANVVEPGHLDFRLAYDGCSSAVEAGVGYRLP